MYNVLEHESVFSQPGSLEKIQNVQYLFLDLVEHKPQLTDFIISQVDIEKAIDELSSNLAGG